MVGVMRRTPLVALAFAGTMACSYIFELPATTTIPGVDGGIDGSFDASVDAPTDAPPHYDAPPVIPFCATQTPPFLFCADFDDEPKVDLATVGELDVDGGVLVLSSAVSHSPPRSLLASIVRGTNAEASVVRALGTDPDGITLSFDMLVSAWTASKAELTAIELIGTNSDCSIRLDGNATTWLVTQVCHASGAETANVTTSSSAPVVKSHWQRFTLSVRFSPTKSVSLDVDGSRVLDAAGVDPLARAQASISLGTHLLPSGSATLFQDNVLVTSP
jgi:hypothetical protein